MKTLSRTRFISLFVLLTILIAAPLALYGCGKRSGNGGQQYPEVVVETLKTEKITLSSELPGRTSAYLVSEIRPQVNGLIQKRLFVEGSDVKAGDDLYQIDPAPFQAAVDRIEAAIPALRFRANRYKEALADKAVSQQAFDDADASLKQAEAELRSAKIQLGYTKITAPISGRIGASSVTDGAIVTAYQTQSLASVQQLDPIYVDIPESASALLRLKRNFKSGALEFDEVNQNKVKLTLEDGTPYSEDGTLQFEDVTVEQSTGSVILRAVFPNPEGVLLPGMFVRATITEGVNDKAVLVSQQSVARNPKGEPYAFVVNKEGVVEMRQLVLDRAIKNKWVVISGAAEGEQVILEGIQNVKPGMQVKTVAFETASK